MRGRLTEGHIFYRDMSRRYPVIEHAEGIFLFEKGGKRIIDGASGAAVVCLGHKNERVIRAMVEQAKKVAFTHMSALSNEPALRLATELAKLTPRRLNRVYFVSSGSEAVETALKLARQYHMECGNTQKYKVISRSISYHGATIGALSLTGHYPRKQKYIPLLSQFPRISTPYCWRCPYHRKHPNCDFECAYELERVILAEDPENISAFIVEPIVGASAPAVAPPQGYYHIVRNICRKYNVLLIADEVMTGCGRTGKFFAMEHYGVFPDIIVLSKGISSGYSPLGALIVDERIYEVISKSSTHAFVHGHTFAGNPLSTAVGLEVIKIIIEENMVERVAESGRYLHKRLSSLKKHPIVGDVRCVGLLAGIEFVSCKKTKRPHPPELGVGRRLQEICFELGLYIYPGRPSLNGCAGDHILLAPPFIITPEQLDMILDILDRAIIRLQEELMRKRPMTSQALCLLRSRSVS